MRTIEFLRGRHVPDTATCDAVAQIEDVMVVCQVPAVLWVRVDGREHFVCDVHLTLLCKEKWPVQPPPKRDH